MLSNMLRVFAACRCRKMDNCCPNYVSALLLDPVLIGSYVAAACDELNIYVWPREGGPSAPHGMVPIVFEINVFLGLR